MSLSCGLHERQRALYYQDFLDSKYGGFYGSHHIYQYVFQTETWKEALPGISRNLGYVAMAAGAVVIIAGTAGTRSAGSPPCRR
jgi:hypothetical protein